MISPWFLLAIGAVALGLVLILLLLRRRIQRFAEWTLRRGYGEQTRAVIEMSRSLHGPVVSGSLLILVGVGFATLGLFGVLRG